jgi:hypothetical protein
MPTQAVQWRSRRAAIGKKGAVDYEMLMDSEVDWTIPSKKANDVTSSPTSIASSHLEFAFVPEMKPLPGSWVTVGKGGRPVSNDDSVFLSTLNPNATEFVPTFYPIEDASQEAKHVDDIMRIMHHLCSVNDSEQLMLAKHFAEANYTVDALEEQMSLSKVASKCLQVPAGRSSKREKVRAQAKEAKYWRKYQQVKQLKVFARDTLIATLADDGLLDEIEEVADEISRPEPLKPRNEKGGSRGAKARRKARFASAAARCYPVNGTGDIADEMPPVPTAGSAQPQPSKSQPQPSKSAEERVHHGPKAYGLKALKREHAATAKGQSEGSSPDVALSSPKEGQHVTKVAKRQGGEGGSAKEEVKKHSKQCIIA